jgi:hypothetical protein
MSIKHSEILGDKKNKRVVFLIGSLLLLNEPEKKVAITRSG